MRYKKRLAKRVIRKAVPKLKYTKKHTKHSKVVHKRTSYKKGIEQILSIKYNAVGNEFVFGITSKNGKVGNIFRVEGKTLINSMGLPFMVINS